MTWKGHWLRQEEGWNWPSGRGLVAARLELHVPDEGLVFQRGIWPAPKRSSKRWRTSLENPMCLPGSRTRWQPGRRGYGWHKASWRQPPNGRANAGWIADGELKPLHELDFFSLDDYVVLARILIAQERLDEATRLLQRLLEAAEAGGRTTRAIEILILQALAFQAGGEHDPGYDRAGASPHPRRAGRFCPHLCG